MESEVKEKSLAELLEEVEKRNNGIKGKKKTLAKHYGYLIRGYDGVEYQRAVRYGTDV